MDHFVGLDVSVKETSVCILDDAGRIVRVRRSKRSSLQPVSPLLSNLDLNEED
jgi:hypothetical protein